MILCKPLRKAIFRSRGRRHTAVINMIFTAIVDSKVNITCLAWPELARHHRGWALRFWQILGLAACDSHYRLALRCGRQPGFATIADIGWLTRDSGFLLIVILQSRIPTISALPRFSDCPGDVPSGRDRCFYRPAQFYFPRDMWADYLNLRGTYVIKID